MEERQKKLHDAKTHSSHAKTGASKTAAQAKKAELAKRKAELKAQKEAERKRRREEKGESDGGGMKAVIISLIVLVVIAGLATVLYLTKPAFLGIGEAETADSLQTETTIEEEHPETAADEHDETEEAKPAEESASEPEPAPEPPKKETPNFIEGRISTPCWVISHSSFVNEKYAKKNERILKRKGYSCGYYWIPDITHGGNRLYKVYVGPFRTEGEAENMLSEIKTLSRQAYLLHLE